MSSFVVLFLTSQYMPIQCVYLEDLATFISTSELVQYFHCTSNLKLRSWFRLPGLSDAEVGLDMEIASGISWTPTFPNDDVLHLCSCLLTATVVEALSSQNVLKLGMVKYHTYMAQKMPTNQAKWHKWNGCGLPLEIGQGSTGEPTSPEAWKPGIWSKTMRIEIIGTGNTTSIKTRNRQTVQMDTNRCSESGSSDGLIEWSAWSQWDKNAG